MYKLLNYLFGWDYIAWKNSIDSGIARVYLSGDGTAFYFRYRNICCIDKIHKPEQVIWLTCASKKYLDV